MFFVRLNIRNILVRSYDQNITDPFPSMNEQTRVLGVYIQNDMFLLFVQERSSNLPQIRIRALAESGHVSGVALFAALVRLDCQILKWRIPN